jgi:hypothetical protein
VAAIQVRGYSERGMINSICYEIRYSQNGPKLLQNFLGMCTFPRSRPTFENFSSATLLIEQSFSDFGDLDLLMLLEGTCTQAICLEAKVKTYDPNYWSLQKEWKMFIEAKNSDKGRSNLFTQLYRKMRLLKKVRNMDEEMAADTLAKRWSLGKNGVVRKAAHALANNCSEAWMVALVPDSKANAHAFFQGALPTPPPGLTDWEYANFGYLTWEEFEAHCRTNAAEWPETLANFEFNRGQIFGQHEAAEPPPPGTVVTWNSSSGPQQVTIKNRAKHNTRVYLSDGTSQRVSNRDLEW